MNSEYPDCNKCKYMVEFKVNTDIIKFCCVGQLIFNSKELLVLDNNVGCEMFEEVD